MKNKKNYDDDNIDSFTLARKFGTYNIQPTADTENEFPAIAQGKPKCKSKKT